MLHVLLTALLGLTGLANMAHAGESTRTYILTTLRRIEVRTEYVPQDSELVRELSQAMGQTVRATSREYSLMTFYGAMAIGKTERAEFTAPYPSYVEDLMSLSSQRQLEINELTGSNWIHLLKPIDKEEESCLWLGKVNNRFVGCGDPWHNGISADEVVCIEGRTYLKCHIDCIKRIHHREGAINDQPGFCPGAAQ